MPLSLITRSTLIALFDDHKADPQNETNKRALVEFLVANDLTKCIKFDHLLLNDELLK